MHPSRFATWAALAMALSLLVSCKAKGTLQKEPEGEHEEGLSAGGCGSERWNVKTGQDPQAGSIALTPAVTTIADLVALSPPTNPPSNARVAPTETTLYRLVNVNITFSKNESDSDRHIVVSDGSSRTMVVEIPDPGCVGSSSWKTLISNARQSFTGQTGTATVQGMGFFDRVHGQTGGAANGIELHPVLGICFGKNCSLGPSPGDAGVDSSSAY
jgi:hypothetical protein